MGEVAGAKGYGEEVGAVAGADGGGLKAAVDVVAHVKGPVDVGDELCEFVWGVAERIEAADDRTHAGAGYIVDGHAYFFEVFKNTDVCGTFCTATTESDADFGACGG